MQEDFFSLEMQSTALRDSRLALSFQDFLEEPYEKLIRKCPQVIFCMFPSGRHVLAIYFFWKSQPNQTVFPMAGARLISDQFSSQTLWIENMSTSPNSATLLTCSSNLTLSIGATAVLEMAAAIPPAKKSLRKLRAWSAILRGETLQIPFPSQKKEGTKSPYRVVGRYLPTQLRTESLLLFPTIYSFCGSRDKRRTRGGLIRQDIG